MTRRTKSSGPGAAVTKRETEILEQLARGRTNKEIAEALGMSPKTVANTLQQIYRKLGVSNRTEASVVAVIQGVICPIELPLAQP